MVFVIRGDAARVRQVSPFGHDGATVVICGLPPLSMPPAGMPRILSGCMHALRLGGVLRLFTNGPRCPASPEIGARLGLVARRKAFVPLNIPLASVHALRRGEDAA